VYAQLSALDTGLPFVSANPWDLGYNATIKTGSYLKCVLRMIHWFFLQIVHLDMKDQVQ